MASLPLSIRTVNVLRSAEVSNLQDLLRMTGKEVLKQPGAGQQTVAEFNGFVNAIQWVLHKGRTIR